jgi:hypothetical protein
VIAAVGASPALRICPEFARDEGVQANINGLAAIDPMPPGLRSLIVGQILSKAHGAAPDRSHKTVLPF